MFGVLNSILISKNFSYLLLRRHAKIRNNSTNAIFASGKLAHTQNRVKTLKIDIHRKDFNELKYASFKKSAPIYTLVLHICYCGISIWDLWLS